MSADNIVVLGAGISGLTAGLLLNSEIYEANDYPGGLCASYYVDMRGNKYRQRLNGDTYRFENGGGHWIHGINKINNRRIRRFFHMEIYRRNSAVFLPDLETYIPYPIQYNLSLLPDKIKMKVFNEIRKASGETNKTLADWLTDNFGSVLCDLFFFPFHDLYTAGLFKKIKPQNAYKTPYDKIMMTNSQSKLNRVGYNYTFGYPKNGLDDIIRKMAGQCKITYNKKCMKIDTKRREILFSDGTTRKYNILISTVPLNRIIDMTEIKINENPGPHISVLVVNIGAKRGKRCPAYHWLYVPKSESGFYRVGFYSNVSKSFLPIRYQDMFEMVSIYVEKAYMGSLKISTKEINHTIKQIIDELRLWGYIDEPEIVDYNLTDIAYTWEYCDSNWRQEALEGLTKLNIYQIGRYGRWLNQGISDSIKDGIDIGNRI